MPSNAQPTSAPTPFTPKKGEEVKISTKAPKRASYGKTDASATPATGRSGRVGQLRDMKTPILKAKNLLHSKQKKNSVRPTPNTPPGRRSIQHKTPTVSGQVSSDENAVKAPKCVGPRVKQQSNTPYRPSKTTRNIRESVIKQIF